MRDAELHRVCELQPVDRKIWNKYVGVRIHDIEGLDARGVLGGAWEAGVQPSVGIRNTASPIEVEEEEGGSAMTAGGGCKSGGDCDIL